MTNHSWRFFRAGGFDQVRIETGADILALSQLDKKLWVALACPMTGMEFDARTMALLDLDHDGRIRADEILAAVEWLGKVLKDPEELSRPGDSLTLAAISTETPEGKKVLAAARHILTGRGKKGHHVIDIEDAADTEHLFDQTRFNGDGIIPASAANDPDTAKLILDIMSLFEAVIDRSGEPGIDQERVDKFYDQLGQFSEWWDKSAADPAILPMGDASHAAFAALAAVEDKIDDFFERCRLSAFSDQAALAANPNADFFACLASRPLTEGRETLRALALAEISAGAALPLIDRLNPAWREEMAAFRSLFAKNKKELTEAEWPALREKFAAHRAWRATMPALDLELLGEERVLAIRALDRKAELDRLITEDKALEDEATAIDDVLRLVLLRRDFMALINNFVSFRDFYTGRGKAMFQAGTLYLDGRSCDLCVGVADVEKHAAMASHSRIYLAYCRCHRADTDETMHIAAAFSAGDSDQLTVGRNGIFYDRSGRDWDASVVKIVEHPISIKQAFMAPYKQISRFIGEQIQKVAQAKSKLVQEDFTKAISAAPGKPAPAATPAPAAAAAHATPFDIGRFAGVFAAIGLAIGAIGTAIAQVFGTFLHLAWWQMPLALIGVVAAISGPSMLIAYFKLRQRNLAPILDANGWAINARVKINIPFGSSLTHLAKLPEGAERSLTDPYAEKKFPWRMWLALVCLLAGAAAAVWLSGSAHKALQWVVNKLSTYL